MRIESLTAEPVAKIVAGAKCASAPRHSADAFYRSLLDPLPQHVFLKVRESVFISVNEAFARDFGQRPEELIHTPHTRTLIGHTRKNWFEIVELPAVAKAA